MANSHTPTELDKIAFDAPLSMKLPSKAWTEAKGGRANNQTSTLEYGKEVPIVDLRGKWIIISGANSGIGKEAALTMAEWGANLILACKEPSEGSHEDHPITVIEQCQVKAFLLGHDSTIEWWPIDMTSFADVEEFAERWLDTGRPLDALCNNAGVGSSPGGNNVFLTKDGFEFIHQINLLSHALLTMMLLPSLAKATAPRVICTTSCFHYLGDFNIANFNGMPDGAGAEGVQYYKNNKLYFQIWLNELQRRVLQHDQYRHITVNGFHPGYVASGIWKVQRQFWLRWLLVWVLSLFASLFGINSKQGSMALVFLATAPQTGPATSSVSNRDQVVGNGGRYFNRIWEEEGMPHAKDPDVRGRVWRKIAQELELEKRGLLDVLGYYGAGSS